MRKNNRAKVQRNIDLYARGNIGHITLVLGGMINFEKSAAGGKTRLYCT
jgi:hypothetical protein